VVDLIALARKAVLSATGIELKPEVKLVGSFDPPLPAELEPHHLVPVCIGAQQPVLDLGDGKKSLLRVQP
jgi:hypothetical protein